jgi:hypothetical protein
MQLHKLMGRIGQGTMPGRKMDPGANYWKKMKVAYEKKMAQNAEHTLNMATLHERNGGRGNGMGLGHQNQHHHRKTK